MNPSCWNENGRINRYEGGLRGGEGIPAELFQILKDDAVKMQHSIYEQNWKTQQ